MKGTPWLVMRIHIQVWWHHLVVWVVDLTYNVKYFNLILLCQSKRLLGHQGNSLCIYMICPCVSAALHADTDTTHSELHTCTTPSKESVKNLNSQKSQPWTAELVMSDMWILSLLLLRLTRMKIWPVWRMSAQVWYSSDQACARHVNLSHHSSYCVINYFCFVRADVNEPSEDSKFTSARDDGPSSETSEEMVNCFTLSFYIWGHASAGSL